VFTIIGIKDICSLSFFILVLFFIIIFFLGSPFISTTSLVLVVILTLNCEQSSVIKVLDLLVLKLFPKEAKLIASKTVVFPLPFGP
tara:strand:+ start:4384 stop:4641 length:258 start_codon:yes stop_codon:yes gene_type:complete